MNKETIKTLMISAGVFAIATAGNVAARSLYTNSKIGVDKKVFIASTAVALGAGYFLLKKLR